MKTSNTTKATLKISSRYAYHVPPPQMIETYYDINGRLIMWDSWACETPKEVLKDKKMRQWTEPLAMFFLAAGFLMICFIIGS